jgi:hypothetical protein
MGKVNRETHLTVAFSWVSSLLFVFCSRSNPVTLKSSGNYMYHPFQHIGTLHYAHAVYLCVPTYRRWSTKLLPIFAERGCLLVSAADPHSRIPRLLDRTRYCFFQVALQLYSRGWVDPVPHPLFLRKSGSTGNWTLTSGSVRRNPDHRSTEIVSIRLNILRDLLSDMIITETRFQSRTKLWAELRRSVSWYLSCDLDSRWD